MSDGYELRVERLIDAPIDAVWRAWTDHLPEWWCPKPWTTDVIEIDGKPENRSAMVMHPRFSLVSSQAVLIFRALLLRLRNGLARRSCNHRKIGFSMQQR